jgi:hypothetical protein
VFANLPVNAVWDGDLEWEDLAEQIGELLGAPWYEDDEGFLYIVAPDEIEGPDSETLDLMNFLLRWGVQEGDLADFVDSIEPVPYVLRRFNRYDGFYHA